MSRLLIKLLLVTFLFGSVNAAVDCAFIDINHEQGIDHLIDDHDKSNDEEDCFHHCHCNCAGQLGLAYVSTIKLVQTSVVAKSTESELYQSKLSPPLFRPPII